MKTIEGDFQVDGARIAIVAARWNGFVVEPLINGAVDALRRHGVDEQNITVVRTPGAFEIPLVLDRVAATGRFDALIALGAVIRGNTPHFDYVAGECVKGISQIALEHGLPVAFGVLTTDSIEQAVERAGSKSGNKGAEAALTVIEMINLLRKIDE